MNADPHSYTERGVFDARYDAIRRCLFVRVSGFWTVADSRDFACVLQGALRTARLAGDDFVCLGDFRAAAVQRPDVVEAKATAARLMMSSSVRRCAIVTSSVLKSLQLRRLIADPRFAFF